MLPRDQSLTWLNRRYRFFFLKFLRWHFGAEHGACWLHVPDVILLSCGDSLIYSFTFQDVLWVANSAVFTQNTDVSTAGKSTACWPQVMGGLDGWFSFSIGRVFRFQSSFIFFRGGSSFRKDSDSTLQRKSAFKVHFETPVFSDSLRRTLWWLVVDDLFGISNKITHKKHTSKICRWLSPRWCAWQW